MMKPRDQSTRKDSRRTRRWEHSESRDHVIKDVLTPIREYEESYDPTVLISPTLNSMKNYDTMKTLNRHRKEVSLVVWKCGVFKGILCLMKINSIVLFSSICL